MTTLIAWTSRDQRYFAAFHMASDSRITWGSQDRRWDAGRKIFTSRITPDIWAYSGDVLFPALVLSQIVGAVDAGLLFGHASSAAERNAVIFDTLKSSFSRRQNAPDQSFSILHASRDGEKTQAQPKLWQISFDLNGLTWKNEPVQIGDKPGVVSVNGSGLKPTKIELRRWENSDIGGTSRSIYSAFCAAIAKGSNPLSGGPPQIASIYPTGPAKIAGVVYDNGRYLHGLPISATPASKQIEWYDPLFQRIDPITLTLLPGAARQPEPKFR
jgi:hypothetical protein